MGSLTAPADRLGVRLLALQAEISKTSEQFSTRVTAFELAWAEAVGRMLAGFGVAQRAVAIDTVALEQRIAGFGIGKARTTDGAEETT